MRVGFFVAGLLSLASLFTSRALGGPGSQSNRSSSEALVLGCFDSGIDPKTWYLFHGTTGYCVDLRFAEGTGSDLEGMVIEGGRRTDICDYSNIDHVLATEIARPILDNLNVAITVAVNDNRQAFRCLFGYCVAWLDQYMVHNSRKSSQAYLERATKLLSRCAVQEGPSVEEAEGVQESSQTVCHLGQGEQPQHRPVSDRLRYLLVYLPQSTLVITRPNPLLCDK
ncbi:hypothetical protein R3P38DRAFT_3116949 [Favolaschia claudopus]|uniref:Uncharacterized protein n=1 Tax=Favolaschia claudopus TaxID=2862362 RepID=A0AAV9ZFN5_9AGAR